MSGERLIEQTLVFWGDLGDFTKKPAYQGYVCSPGSFIAEAFGLLQWDKTLFHSILSVTVIKSVTTQY